MKNASFSTTLSINGDNTTRLLLEGQLTIKNAKAIRNELVLALNSPKNLEMVLKNIDRMDLTVLQLLIALQKSASKLEKKLSFDIELTDYMKSVIINSGLEHLLLTKSQSHINGIH